jgi:hypothetical protein
MELKSRSFLKSKACFPWSVFALTNYFEGLTDTETHLIIKVSNKHNDSKENTMTKEFTKAQQNSIERIKQALTIIETLVPLERKRFSQKRKHDLGKAYASLSLHAGKFGVVTPRLGYMYQENEYLTNARRVKAELLIEWRKITGPEDGQGID